MMDMDHFLMSRPVRLNWAGWETDTYRLQQAGWQLSAHQNYHRMTMGIALQNEREGIRGITGEIAWDFYKYRMDRMGLPEHLPELPVRLMSHKIEVMHTMGNPFADYRPIDAQPQFSQRRVSSLEDLVHFAPNLARTQQIIVPEETVDDLMARILEMQNTSRIERIRQEVREGDRVNFENRQKFHAQIISLAA